MDIIAISSVPSGSLYYLGHYFKKSRLIDGLSNQYS